jgi:chitodextrinase/predicted esterase
MLRIIILSTFCLLAVFNSSLIAQNVFDPKDPIVQYDASKPPAANFNTITKWVKGNKATFNTDKFKSYIFNNMAFRLRYPNGYDPKDTKKKYPIVLFMHGGGETDSKYINDYNILIGGEIFEKKIDSGLFNGFLLFPQAESPGWEAYYPAINKVLDSLEKYCHTDPDRMIAMGISMGGLAAVQYSMQFPQRSAVAIGSSPALIQVLSNRAKELITVPVWLGSGTLDLNPSVESVQSFVDAFTDQGGFIRYENFPVGHESWYPHWLAQPPVPVWNSTHKANPLVYYNKTQVPKGEPVNARLALTPGFAAYEWQRNNVTIPGTNRNEIVVTSLGTYRARFKRTAASEWSEWSQVPATITGPVDDRKPPTTPQNLYVVNSTPTTIELNWESSSDNTGIASYEIYENDQKKYRSDSSSIVINGLISNTVYRYTVRAIDAAGNLSESSNSINVRTKMIEPTSGLSYKYYEGNWNELPDFAQLYAKKMGFTSTVDISPRTSDNFYSFLWEGYLKIPVSGNYTFELVSDDGSKMYFNGHYVSSDRPFINNDRVHNGAVSVSNNVDAGAGIYPVAFTFFTKEKEGQLELYWTGPGIARQLVPASAFVTEIPAEDRQAPASPSNLRVATSGANFIKLEWKESSDNVGVMRYEIYENNSYKYTSAVPSLLVTGLQPSAAYNYYIRAIDRAGNASGFSSTLNANTADPASGGGLTYKYYEGDWESLPDFNALKPVKTGTSPTFDLGVRNTDDYFGVVWEGFIRIPAPGNYTFELASDDGSKFYFNKQYSAGAAPLLNNDGLHDHLTPVKGTVQNVAAGTYPIALAYFEKWGFENLSLYWSGPNLPRQLVPASAFAGGQSAIAVSSAITGTGNTVMMDNEATLSETGGRIKLGSAYPNPFAEAFTIDYTNVKANGRVEVQVFDLSGRQVTRKYFGQLPAGTSRLRMTIQSEETRRSVYLARVTVDGIPIRLLKVVRQSK